MAACIIAVVNYELFMGEALSEARLAIERGGPPQGVVAVVREAMVVRAQDRVDDTHDPTAHAVIVALRETARRLGPEALSEATIFAVVEPCAMCVGALLEGNVEELVFAVPDRAAGAAGGAVQLAQHAALSRHLKVVSGIRRDEAEDLAAQAGSNGR